MSPFVLETINAKISPNFSHIFSGSLFQADSLSYPQRYMEF